MRQAGRYLPEYRQLKAKYGFLQLVRTPELACEVTLQPLRRFALDAAIVFSDILVIPEALGVPYFFRDAGGIAMERAIRSMDEVQQLRSLDEALSHTRYVYEALALLRREIGNTTALLGFAGSPWTLATYMVEGGSSTDFSTVSALFRSDRPMFDRLMERLSDAVAQHLKAQLEAGADAVQIFDSWAAACPDEAYWDRSLQWIARIMSQLPFDRPVILYAKGKAHLWPALSKTGAQVLGIAHDADLPALARECPAQTALQGNLDPALMEGPITNLEEATETLLAAMAGRPGFILNLGHGIRPFARIENVTRLVELVHGW